MVQVSPFQDRRPLYQVVAEELIAGIQRGDYAVGAILPSEAELCERFKVSRNTVREAVRLMEQTGMVSRRQGVGTRVERNSVDPQYTQTLTKLSDLWQYVKETRRKVVGIENILAKNADICLPGDPQALWRRLDGLRYFADEARPIAWTQVFLPNAYGAVLDKLDRDDALICSLVEANFGVVTQSVQQEICAVEIPAAIARLLNVKPKSAGLAMLRRYVSDKDETYEVTWSIHPANRYKYDMKIVRSYGMLPKG